MLRKKYPREPELTIAVNAEKQHIIPYKRLKEIFELTTGPRLGSHFVNDIGNLTYISELFNGFAVGIGSKALNLDAEPKDNLRAHFLLDDRSDLLGLYTLACNSTRRKAARRAYKRFCVARRELIASAFVDWAEELSSVEMHPAAPQLPIPRVVSPTDVDLIASLGFDNVLTAALLKLRLRDDARSAPENQKQNGEMRFAVVQRRSGGRSTQRLRVDIDRPARLIKLKVSDPELREWCINKQLASDESRTKEALRVILSAQEDSVAPLLEDLDSVLTQTSQREPSLGQSGKTDQG